MGGIAPNQSLPSGLTHPPKKSRPARRNRTSSSAVTSLIPRCSRTAWNSSSDTYSPIPTHDSHHSTGLPIKNTCETDGVLAAAVPVALLSGAASGGPSVLP